MTVIPFRQGTVQRGAAGHRDRRFGGLGFFRTPEPRDRPASAEAEADVGFPGQEEPAELAVVRALLRLILSPNTFECRSRVCNDAWLHRRN